MPDQNIVFVLASTRRAFETICSVDWEENPRDRKFVVFIRPEDVLRGHARNWREGDKFRIVDQLGCNSVTMQETRRLMLMIGAPPEVLERLDRAISG